MKDYKGYRLYVNLGPAQVRRRLRGYGFGVKTVQSAGTARALIIHTATGTHRDRLEALFADVLSIDKLPATADAESDAPSGSDTQPDARADT